MFHKNSTERGENNLCLCCSQSILDVWTVLRLAAKNDYVSFNAKFFGSVVSLTF
jgi:hypothetical protein